MRLFFITPFVIFLLMVIVFLSKLIGDNPKDKNLMVGQDLPPFELLSYGNDKNLKSEDLKGYYLINIFGSWCVVCKIEHPFLMKIKEKGILPIYGINWRDRPENLTRFLNKLGNPYEKIGIDSDNMVILSLGVTGAPESFLISPENKIIFQYSGALTEDIFNDKILPLIKK